MNLEKEVETFKLSSKPNSSNVQSEGLPNGPYKHNLKGHRDNINSVKFHPEYDSVCSASEDATIRAWDLEGGKVEKVFKGHTGAVRDIDFNPKGNLLDSVVVL
jgi:platelet-activating factor acetylhydrolase IB subunit alpha